MAYLIAASKLWNPTIDKDLAKKLGKEFLILRDPEKLTNGFINENKITKIFFVHWSHIIKVEIFDSVECIIFHMTDLPFGRGGSPLQNLIVRGHKETKISALKCQEGVDAGPIYLKRPLSLAGTAQEIYQRASGIVEEMIVEIEIKKIEPVPQKGEVTLFKRRKPEDGNISNLESLEEIYNFIRMLDADGYPPAFLEHKNLRIEFSDASLTSEFVEAKVRIKV